MASYRKAKEGRSSGRPSLFRGYLLDVPQRPSAADEWSRCRGWIAAALEHDGGFYSLPDIERLIAEGHAHFWAGERSAAITQFWWMPRCKVLNMWLAGGDMSELIEKLFPSAQYWAIQQDCSKIMLAGRPGWARVFAPLGFKPLSTILIKDLIP